MLPLVRHALAGVVAALLVGGCSSGPSGGLSIGARSNTTVAADTEPNATGGSTGPATDERGRREGPGRTDTAMPSGGDVLGGQAAISRPVGDDGTRPAVHDDRVFLLGDSIMASGAPGFYDTLRRQLVPLGWKPTVDAEQGRTTAEGLKGLRRHRAEIHDVVVVLLGHNDPVDRAAYRSSIDAIVEELTGVPLVLLLTNYEFETGRDRMNDELRVVAALDDNVELVDWNAVVSSTPGVIGPDGLHLTERGARVLAATVAAALGPAPGP